MHKEEAINLARILHQALPWLDRYRGLYIVAKLGGNVLHNRDLLQSFARDLVLMNRNGICAVAVHGGGPHITARLAEQGIETRFVDGLRFSDARVAATVEEILAAVNLEVSEAIQAAGGEVASFADCSARLIRAQTTADGRAGERTGEVCSIDVRQLQKSCHAERKIPVISPIGHDAQGRPYNVNADSAAGFIAQGLRAEKFILLTNVPGILYQGTLQKELNALQVREMIDRDIIQEGMLPKVLSILHAIEGGVPRAHIIDANLPHAALLEILTDEGVGTLIKAHPEA